MSRVWAELTLLVSVDHKRHSYCMFSQVTLFFFHGNRSFLQLITMTTASNIEGQPFYVQQANDSLIYLLHYVMVAALQV